jgi:Na+-transporting NADH:ubiquinone oxidoreductase subunit A
MRDIRRPEILFAAPASGRIARIERGARRKLETLIIEVDPAISAVEFAVPLSKEQDAQRAFMLQTGSWSNLRTRPFGNVPGPLSQPAAILITAIDTEPLAPPVEAIIDAFAGEFSAAVTMLAGISKAPLYICHQSAYRPPFDDASGAICKAFKSDHRAGLPGTHIQALCPLGFVGSEVWHIGYQETIALGHLLLHGRPWLQRIISLVGDTPFRPRCLQVTPGAAIAELLAAEVDAKAMQLLSASTLNAGKSGSKSNFLSATQRQLRVNRPVVVTPGGISSIIPGDWLEGSAPAGIHPIPLMRALQLGDVERARDLGALELVEEDLAALSNACVSNSDYGLLLRTVLDQLEAMQQ